MSTQGMLVKMVSSNRKRSVYTIKTKDNRTHKDKRRSAANCLSSHFSDIEGIIFDLDGTLIQSKIDFIEMKHQILRYIESIGGNLENLHSNLLIPDIISKILDDAYTPESVQQMLERVNQIMNDVEIKHVDDATPIPEVEQALLFLHKRGIKMSVLTRSGREYAIKCLEKVRFISFIDHLIARDDFHQSKPDPIPALILAEKMRLAHDEILIVGDHALDVRCAKNAHMPFLGVLTGSYTEKEFKKLKCTFIPNLKELSLFFQT